VHDGRFDQSSGVTPTSGRQIAPWSVDGALEFMDRHAIAAQVSSVAFDFTGPVDDPNFPVRRTRQVNEAYADLIEDHPDRFGAFASIPFEHGGGPDRD
jgi:predicted TIM-barrel fold metal-dependent hydrolase